MEHQPTPRLLWKHSNPETTRTYQFKETVENKYAVTLRDYEALQQWSIDHLDKFWQEVWQFTGIRASKPFAKALDETQPMFPRPPFFQGATLNFAENLLYPPSNPNELSYAVVEANEVSNNYVTWKELRERVRQCSHAMQHTGVKEGDRVAGYLANHCYALVAMLSASSIGALWTAISPDTGVHAMLDRVQQIDPVMLLADNAVMYNGKVYDMHDKLKDIVNGLPNLKACVVFEIMPSAKVDLSDITFTAGKASWYKQLVLTVSDNAPLEFLQLPPDHPIYILYSSGTTGKPKCIVHGAIGTLLQHKKEHDIQCSIRPGDRLFYFTTCTWMMWHWLVSGLATGATVVLYDGSPFRPLDEKGKGEMAMPHLIQELGITHFGTSAKYLSILEQKSVKANQLANLSTLKAIYSTGSPLAPSTFSYVYEAFGPDINLGSITGGTDIISLFGAPSQISPVYAGEIQVRGLGMAVEAWSFDGKNVTDTGEPGDLVCVKPFPCQPVMIWGKDGEEKYRKSYFEAFPGVWHHGDFVRMNPETGGLIMLGRSDGVLKPAGVRFGSSEIYNIVLQHFHEVEEAICVGRRREYDLDEVVVLFVKMAQGQTFSADLGEMIKGVIRKELSARHVPGMIDETPEIPVTMNGKKYVHSIHPQFLDGSRLMENVRVEVAVKQILCGTNVKTSASVANPDCLHWYRRWNDDHPD
ncbi:MAG: hypothetical protein Q9217_000326 [Psora testacea]